MASTASASPFSLEPQPGGDTYGLQSPPRGSRIQELLAGLDIDAINLEAKADISEGNVQHTQTQAAAESVFAKLGISPQSPDRARKNGSPNTSSSSSVSYNVSSPQETAGTFLNDLRSKMRANSSFVFSERGPSSAPAPLDVDHSSTTPIKTSTFQV
jgi:hypothetical protein